MRGGALHAPGVRQALGLISRLAASAVVSFAFFVLISMLHSLFGVAFAQKAPGGAQRRVEAEMVRRTPPEQRRAVQQRIRQVAHKGGPSQRGNADPTALRFTPDLSLESGAEGTGVALARQELQAEVFDEGQTDEDAVAVSTAPVAYPERARELGVQGTVEVIFVIDHTGRVGSLDVVRSPHPSITAEVKRTISAWRFKPARNKGVPVNLRVRQVIEFRLDGQ